MNGSEGKAAMLIIGILVGVSLIALVKGCDAWESHQRQGRLDKLVQEHPEYGRLPGR
jgi:hypothetical protein